MESSVSLNDNLNLRDFIGAITDFIREGGSADAQPKNIVGFFSVVLDLPILVDGKKDPTINMLQKLLSGNIPLGTGAVQALAEEICSGAKDPLLREKLGMVADTVAACGNEKKLYGLLCSRLSLRFFAPEEKHALQHMAEQGEYVSFLLALLKHGFSALYNLPCFFAERLYAEAITCDYDSPHRFALMKLAAENGNRDAAMEYGNYLARSGPDSGAEDYFMMALPKPSAAWAFTYLIEIGWTSDKWIERFRSAFRTEEKLASEELREHLAELEGLCCIEKESRKAETMLFVYRAYFCLAYQGFFKAFNSLAKLLEQGEVYFAGPEGEQKAEQLCRSYRRAGIGASNVLAALNEGRRLMEKRMTNNEYAPDSEEEQYMRELLELAAGMELRDANFYLATYLEYEGKRDPGLTERREQALEHYRLAVKQDVYNNGMDGRLWLQLGKISDSPEEKTEFLTKALKKKQWEAAYYLAELEAKQYMAGGNAANLHLLTALELLRDNLELLTGETREKAKKLQRALESLSEDIGSSAERPALITERELLHERK